MTVEYFKKTLQKIIKKMKCDIYVIGPDFIIGSNPENSYISEVIGLTNGLENIYEKFPGSIIEITKDGLNETEIMIDKNPNMVDIDMLLWQFSSTTGHYGISNLLESYYRTKNNICNKIPDYYCDNMKDNEEFNNILKLKAAAGAVPFRLNDEDVIYIYPGLLGINKTDHVSVNMFRNAQNGIDICEFIINKKFVVIHKYMGYIPLR